MANIPREPTIAELSRKLKRLEILVMALVASDGIGSTGDPDELFYLFRRYFRDLEGSREDRDFYRFLEHLFYDSRERGNGFREIASNLEKRFEESKYLIKDRLEYSEHKLESLSQHVESVEKNQRTT